MVLKPIQLLNKILFIYGFTDLTDLTNQDVVVIIRKIRQIRKSVDENSSTLNQNKMKKIEAIVKPSKLKAIQAGLIAADIPCMTVMPVKGAGLQKGYAEIYRGTERPLILLPKVMIFCVVSDENVEKCINVILDNASEENVGDGKIFVYDVVEAIRIRNRVRGNDAIR
jgi:nitrogen regulatory protein P-II 1